VTIKVIIVDDQPLVRGGLRMIIDAAEDMELAAEAGNGHAAVECARRTPADVILMDVQMPAMDGLEATRQIMQAAPKTKVLILTMHESDQMVRRVLEAGARGYVLKSDLAAHLVDAVEDIVRGRLSLTPKVSEIVVQGFLKAERESKQNEHAKVRPTPRELEIIRLLADGKANKEIASALGITVRTVETHRAKIMLKLGLHSLTEVIQYAIRHKIIPAPSTSE